MSDQTPRRNSAYVVLKMTNHESTEFAVVAESVPATNAESAVRTHLEGIAADERAQPVGGTYIAVPVRLWKPVVVKTATKTVIEIT